MLWLLGIFKVFNIYAYDDLIIYIICKIYFMHVKIAADTFIWK